MEHEAFFRMGELFHHAFHLDGTVERFVWFHCAEDRRHTARCVPILYWIMSLAVRQVLNPHQRFAGSMLCCCSAIHRVSTQPLLLLPR